MIEHFTEKAVKVVTLAQQQAKELQHSYVYPEHLLISTLQEGTSLSSKFLKASKLTVEVLQEEIKHQYPTDEVTEYQNFSNDVKKILKLAWDKAKLSEKQYITAEHIFLSLINDPESNVSKLLSKFTVDTGRIRASIVKVTEKKPTPPLHPEGTQSSDNCINNCTLMNSAFENDEIISLMNSAKNKAQQQNYELIGTEQILSTILEDNLFDISSLIKSQEVETSDLLENINNYQAREEDFLKGQYHLTPKALFIINSANQIAKELGATSTSAEHIILAILQDKSNNAFKVINNSGLNSKKLQQSIISPIESKRPATLSIINSAKSEARRLGHNIVGTELILLGLLTESDGIAAKVLKDLGVTIKDTRIEVEKNIGFGDSYLDSDINLTTRAKRILENAWEEAKKFGYNGIKSEHLLLGIIKEKECVAMKVLENLALDALEVKQGIIKELELNK